MLQLLGILLYTKQLNEQDKKLYKIVYLDYETQSVPYGYILK